MAVADSLREKILADFITTLKKIRVSNSYRNNVETGNVSRSLKDAEELDNSEFPWLCAVASSESLRWLSNKEVESKFTVAVIGYVLWTDHDEDGTTASSKLEKLIADCREVIMDRAQPLATNANALHPNVITVETDEGIFEPFAAFRMIVEVEYQTADNDVSLKVVT